MYEYPLVRDFPPEKSLPGSMRIKEWAGKSTFLRICGNKEGISILALGVLVVLSFEYSLPLRGKCSKVMFHTQYC